MRHTATEGRGKQVVRFRRPRLQRTHDELHRGLAHLMLTLHGAGQGEGGVGAALVGDRDGGICALMQEALHIAAACMRGVQGLER